MAVDIGPKIGIDGEKEFRDQLSQVNQAVKTLGSEMKLVTAEFGRNAQSEEALTKKNDVLERTVLTLNDKLKMQQEMLAKSVSELGEADEKTMKWQQAVNETQAALAKSEREIRENTEALENLANGTDDAGDEFQEAGKQAASFGDVLRANVIGDVIMKGVEALGNGIRKIGSALKDAVVDSAAFADDMLTMSQTTGLSTDALQEYKYMSDLVDVNLETITGSLSKLTKNMASAKKGTGATADAFKQLGVQITKSDGSLRDNQDVFNDVLDALGGISNETERDAIAMQIFGKSAQDLLPMIIAGGDAVRAFAEEAHQMGYVLDESTLSSLGTVQESFDRFHLTVDALKNNLASALAPVIEDLSGKLIAWAQSVDWETVGAKLSAFAEKIRDFFDFVSEHGDAIVAVLAAIAAGFVAFEVTSLIMGVVEAFSAFREALIAGKTAQEALNLAMSLNPATIVITAISALVAALIVLWNTNEDFRNWVINAWGAIKEWVSQACKDVVNWIKGAWEDIQNFFKRAADWFKDIGHNIVTGIWEGIKNATQWLVGKITGWFDDVVGAVKRFLKISSPSKLMADQVGKYMAQGVGVGFENEFATVSRDINSSLGSVLPDSISNIGVVSAMSGGGMRSAMAASVNAIGSLMGANANAGNLNIVIQADGREFYKATINDFRLIQSQNPIILNDF